LGQSIGIDETKEYIYLMGSEKLPSACYILSDESGIPLYSRSNGYNKRERYSQVPLIENWYKLGKNVKMTALKLEYAL